MSASNPGSSTSSLALFVALATAACAGGSKTTNTVPSPAPAPTSMAATGGIELPRGAAKARADSARYPYTEGDIEFMSGMISHHAQAIKMARWAESHGASPSVVTLAGRVINAQNDEIATMQTWLRDRNQAVPEPDPNGMKMKMNGADHVMLMPGMLTPEQMAQLDAARGSEFDRLFLTFMIQHHQGAISMVKKLFDTYGAGQDEVVFKFASDVNVDQTTEVARMERMLFVISLDKKTSR